MDSQLRAASDMSKSMVERKLRLTPQMEDWEREELVRSHDEYYEKHFPSTLRYSFVLLLWVTVETQLKATCDRLAKERSQKLALADIRADSVLSRCRKYLEKVVGVDVSDSSLWAETNTLQKLRNSIIHANGILKAIQSHGDRKHLRQYFRRNLGLSRDPWGAVAVAPTYCRHVLSIVEKLFREIFESCGWAPDKQGQIIG